MYACGINLDWCCIRDTNRTVTIRQSGLHLLDVGVIVNMVHTIAVVAVAPGTVAELHVGIIDVSFATDRTLMAVDGLRSLFLIVPGPVGIWLLSILSKITEGLSASVPGSQEIRQNLQNIRTEENKIIQQSTDDKNFVGQRIDEKFVGNQHEVEPSHVFQFHGNDIHQQDPVFREHRGKGQQQAQVQVRDIGVEPKEQCRQIREDDAGKIVEIKPEGTPLTLQRLSDKIVKIQGNGQEHHVGVGWEKNIRNQAPDLTMQNSTAVKRENSIEQLAGIHEVHEIHYNGTCYHI